MSTDHHVLNGDVPADTRRPHTSAVVLPVRRADSLAVSILLPCRLQMLPARGGLLPINLAAPCTGGCQMAAARIVPGVRRGSQSYLQRAGQVITAAWADRVAAGCAPKVLPFQLQRTGHRTVGPVHWIATNMSKCLRRNQCVTIDWTLHLVLPSDAACSGELCVDTSAAVQCKKVKDTAVRSLMQRRSL